MSDYEREKRRLDALRRERAPKERSDEEILEYRRRELASLIEARSRVEHLNALLVCLEKEKPALEKDGLKVFVEFFQENIIASLTKLLSLKMDSVTRAYLTRDIDKPSKTPYYLIGVEREILSTKKDKSSGFFRSLWSSETPSVYRQRLTPQIWVCSPPAAVIEDAKGGGGRRGEYVYPKYTYKVYEGVRKPLGEETGTVYHVVSGDWSNELTEWKGTDSPETAVHDFVARVALVERRRIDREKASSAT